MTEEIFRSQRLSAIANFVKDMTYRELCELAAQSGGDADKRIDWADQYTVPTPARRIMIDFNQRAREVAADLFGVRTGIDVVGIIASALERVAVEARNEALEEGWQPIETAPKDGSRFDAFAKHTSGITTRIPAVHWDLELKNPRWWSNYGYAGAGGWIDPSWTLTHWMPDPGEPKAIRQLIKEPKLCPQQMK